MQTPKLVIIGAGGHSKSVIEAVESAGHWEIIGLLDPNLAKGSSVLSYPVLGADEEISAFLQRGVSTFIGIGQVKDAGPRIRVYNYLKKEGATLPVVIASTAQVSRHANIAEGTVVMHGAIVNAEAFIGHNCIINTGAIIEHCTQIDAHTHIATGARINGDCTIGRKVFIGSGAVLKEGVQVHDGALIGAGSIVLADVPAGQRVVGLWK
jgi:sugar O-acyltransferase (sialic acid O-acetyltransferase NeuD family)